MPLITLGGLEFRPNSQSAYTENHSGDDTDCELERLTFTRIKPLALLTYLTLEGEQRRSFMAELIWGNAKAPKNSTSQAIDQLMRLLPGAIEKTDTRVKALISSDAVQFREAVRQEKYLEAIALYQGDFLKGIYLQNNPNGFEEWIAETSNLLAEEAQMALSRQAQLDLKSPDAAIQARSKDFAEQAYKIFERTQVGETNLPLLYAVLEHHGSVYAAKVKQVLEEFEMPTNGIVLEVSPIGQVAPNQQDAADVSKDVPKHITKMHISKLPSYSSTFFGRKTELKDSQHMLSQPECQLLTLSGPGGMGKTRLATELSYIFEQSGEFDVVSFVNLEPQTDPSQIANTIAQTLELRLDAARPALEQLITSLQAKKHLIALDNFEHLLDEETNKETKAMVSDLLEGCPLLKLLVTTRERLGIGQEWLLDIEALNHPKAIKKRVAEIETFDAVELFVDRAKHANIHFKLTKENLDTVQKLILQTAGLPLAIELAASWVRALPANAILEELENSLDILSSTTHTNKHRSLETTFEHSWQRLSDVEQRILQALSVFENGFSKEAATFLTNVSYVQLMQLINKSLVQTTESGRYVLHPLLGQYLDDKLQTSGSKVEIQASHAEYYMDYFSSVAKGFRTKKEGEALDAVEVDIENIKQAWLYACEFEDSENNIESSLIWELRRFFDTRSQQVQGAKFFTQIAEFDNIQTQSDLYGLVLAANAWLCLHVSDYDEAEGLANDAYKVVKESANISAKINVANTVGSVAFHRADYQTSTEYFQETVDLAKLEENSTRRATYLRNLSIAQRRFGDYENSKLNLQEALKVSEEHEDISQRSNSLTSLGTFHMDLDEFKEAKPYLESALKLAEENRFEQSLPTIYANLTNVYRELGDLTIAELYCQKTLESITGETHHSTRCMNAIDKAEILAAKGELENAEQQCIEALQKSLKYNQIRQMLRGLIFYAELLIKQSENKDAATILHAVVEHPNIEKTSIETVSNLIKEHGLQSNLMGADTVVTAELIVKEIVENGKIP